ncbi:pyranose oxidase [Saccharopolyspora antimicrobica]|uniref:Pyranose oxidase n=1 Tax=Saccharopolyspora antimicrobica TaxID=455193 RepID=A0A1I4VRJ0_9PSEU|nr:GMC oxidoreductase [Saccharopolyspora antimicrobica]RKT87255.1 pyranose oxidase [Saccharopolyspora antimicrobica]SFN03596.1 pyranose oxidase [Saccharopolyspora antimicrobica]
MSHQRIEVDVLVVGSGPVGATFARTLVDGGREVMVVDAGPQLSSRPGEHLKNHLAYQHSHERFGALIRGHLHPLSRPARAVGPPEELISLAAGVATYAVGGMATHWTGVTPRHHPTVERSNAIPAADWDSLYGEAEALLNTRTDLTASAISHQVVIDALAAEYAELPAPYGVQHLPMAAERRADNPGLVRWTGVDTILGPLADGDADGFVLREQHQCTRLVPAADGSRIEYAEIIDHTTWRTLRVEASTYVVACGAVLTPQLLHASGIRPPALGRHLTEQPVAFCQILLRDDLVEGVAADPRFAERVAAHRTGHPDDALPIPLDDLDPNVWIPVSQDRPWHCQIHRDLPYDDMVVDPDLDGRLVVDLRWFGLVDPRPENRVLFSDTARDRYGMPEAGFEFSLSDSDRARQHRMMADLRRAAAALGPYVPGSEPRFILPTLPLHIAGTTRMGTDPDTSVVDPGSRVWGVENLYLGGNGLIPTGNASNPTLTSVAMALRAARGILRAGQAFPAERALA